MNSSFRLIVSVGFFIGAWWFGGIGDGLLFAGGWLMGASWHMSVNEERSERKTP